MRSKRVLQSSLSNDCYSIQVWGTEACNTCEYKDTKECGGKAIIAKIKAGSFPQNGLPGIGA